MFSTEDLDNIVHRANAEDVNYMQTICTRLDKFDNILNIAKKFDNVFASVGLHPNEVHTHNTQYNEQDLMNLAQHPKVIGFGETGLDYYYESTHKDMQKTSFIKHIIASQNLNLPLIVHTRDAEEDTTSILTQEMHNMKFPGLIHCFTGSISFARKMLDIGMYISISGIVTFKNAEHVKEVARFTPIDRLLIETDSPYLAPVPMRGKTNEPSFVKYIADYIAELKSLTTKEVINQTTKNFFQLFAKAKK